MGDIYSTILLRTAISSAQYKSNNRSPVVGDILRLQQYEIGLNRFFSLNFHSYNSAILLVDNTLRSVDQLPASLKRIIPNYVNIILTGTNKFGRYNKGAGDMETMRFLFKKKQIPTKYFFHFEPRLFIKNPDFILDFLQNPRPLISISKINGLAVSGYYGADKESITNLVNKTSLVKMCLKSTSIEKILLEHAKRNYWQILNKSEYCVRFDPVEGPMSY